MLVVTGGAGFIGSNLVHGLNRAGHRDVMVVDDLSDSSKVRNLVGARIQDYADKDDFHDALRGSTGWLDDVQAVFHQGACSSTTEADGRYVMQNNLDYSKAILGFCRKQGIPLIYASSAAVYGDGTTFREEPELERPLNVYGLSKTLFDVHVRSVLDACTSQVVGLRYFNVYGPREAHKGSMASVALQLDDQILADGTGRLFGASEGYEPGEQRRDFVWVDDVVDVALWFFENPDRSGIFNCGSGQSRTFNDLAAQVTLFHGGGAIEYIPFPDSLRGKYQGFTEADLTRLRDAGYEGELTPIEEGVPRYLAWRRESGEVTPT